MGFHEVQFPTDISYGSVFTVEDQVVVIENGAGNISTWQQWTNPRMKANIAWAVKTNAELAALLAFFHARRGPANGFRVKNWRDYTGTSQTATMITTRTYQICKLYSDAGGSYTKEIKKLVSGTLKVYDNGTLKSTPADYTVDITTGIITFTYDPVTPVTCDFEYDIPMRFVDSELPQTLDSYGINSVKEINMVEVRL
ncbi:MAG: DUF2460 domain-containing protein [Thermodesulfobacteriota bacterium]|jgi:uncharacterized protein (TIGR02217 family)|nr:MAG: DUF2460 domain-containing protein [Thermodesulfobacteriota bacterium]